MASSVKLACVVLMCMAVVGAPMAQAAVDCNKVRSNVLPCLGFLEKGGSPSPGCCNGIKSIVNSARTTGDRQGVCNCLKSAASNVHGIDPRNAEALPGRCGVNIPYKISTSTNCARYTYAYMHASCISLGLIFI